MRSRRGKFKRTTPGEGPASAHQPGRAARGDRASAPGPRPAAHSHALSCESLSPPEYASSGKPGLWAPNIPTAAKCCHRLPSAGGSRWARPTRTRLWGEPPALGSRGNRATLHDLAQPQPRRATNVEREAAAAAGAAGGGAACSGPRAGARAARLLRPRRRGVVSAGAAHGARPLSSGARLPRAGRPRPRSPKAARSAGARPGEPRRGALRTRRAAPGARGPAGRAPGRPNSYKPPREGWPAGQPARAKLASSLHPGLPFLPFALPPCLSHSKASSPSPSGPRGWRLWVGPAVPRHHLPAI